MKFIGYWREQLIVAEYHELLACRHYYRDGEYYGQGDWVVRASIGLGSNKRCYYICPADGAAKEGYRPFRDCDEANGFIESVYSLGLDAVDLRKLGVVCAFMEDSYAKVSLIDAPVE